MLLKELIKEIENLDVRGSTNIKVNNVTKNSSENKPGDLFVAIKGSKSDGHDFINDAIIKGAKCILCEKIIDVEDDNLTFVITKCSKETYSRVCSNFFDNPSNKLKLIGITGTNGKTTSSNLLYQMFTINNIKSGLISTNEIIIGSDKFETSLTTPDSYDLNFYLNKMVSNGIRFCFMEVSSHAIDQRRISGLNFDLAIFTNITHDHLNYHKTFKNYLNVKKRFFDPSLTGIIFLALAIIMSKPAFSAAAASSTVFAVTWVNFLLPLAAFKSPTVVDLLAGFAAHVYTFFIKYLYKGRLFDQ